LATVVLGFVLGKSPNPMEGAVKLFKTMVGLYPDALAKTAAFFFFIGLAVVGNKLVCGWACPFGGLTELLYSIPWLTKIKRHKVPFWVSNSVRGGLFILMIVVLFGIIGGNKGFVIHHLVNPFNLFNYEFEGISILVTVVVSLILGLVIYRPFCQFICPFGFLSWIAERVSLYRVRVNHDTCTECGNCIRACPSDAAKGRVEGKMFPADCFSCARCLNVCPVDATRYEFIGRRQKRA
jgi:polyferredoxin